MYVGEPFTVNLTVSYDFSLATYVGAGISDPEIAAWVELEHETLYGEGTVAYSFELIAPEEETTQIFEASVWYYSEDEWIHGEVDWIDSFVIKVIEPEPEKINVGISGFPFISVIMGILVGGLFLGFQRNILKS